MQNPPSAPAPTVKQRCQWPHGDPRDRNNFRFCGDPVAAVGAPYCAEHYRRAYVRPFDSRRETGGYAAPRY